MSVPKNAHKKRNPIMQLTTVVPESANQFTEDSAVTKLIPITQNQSNKVLPTFYAYEATNSKCNIEKPIINAVHTIQTASNIKVVKKVPILKITINKIYKRSCISTIHDNTHTLDDVNNITFKVKETNSEEIKPDLKYDAQNIHVSPKPGILNLVPVIPERSINYKSVSLQTKNVYTPKTTYTRKGDLSRDNSRNQTSAERIRYLYTKAHRDCNILKIRLKALKERYKQEKEEIRKLQAHLGDFCRDVTEEYINEMSKGYSRSKQLSVSSESTVKQEGKEKKEEEVEYERLLRKVRKIKQDILNSKYSVATSNRKLEQINLLNHEKNKIKKEYTKSMKNNISELNVTENGEIIDEIYNNSTESIKVFYNASNFNVKFNDGQTLSSKKYSGTFFTNI